MCACAHVYTHTYVHKKVNLNNFIFLCYNLTCDSIISSWVDIFRFLSFISVFSILIFSSNTFISFLVSWRAKSTRVFPKFSSVDVWKFLGDVKLIWTGDSVKWGTLCFSNAFLILDLYIYFNTLTFQQVIFFFCTS